MKLYTAAETRRIDEYTIKELGTPSIILMERASNHIASEALGIMGDGDSASVFCGHGNNGGDGIGAAAALLSSGKNVRVFLAGERSKMTPDSCEMERRLNELGVHIEDFKPDDPDIEEYVKNSSVIIDAVYGFGFRLPLNGAALEAARLINSTNVPVIAADIPSGVETDTGRASEDAVKADVTVTFSVYKIGQFVDPGSVFCGKVLCKDIRAKIPSDVDSNIFAVSEQDVRLPARPRDAHKGFFGRDIIIAGKRGITGAPSFAAHAAVRSGAGLVHLAVPEAIYEIEAIKNDEAMVLPLPCDGNGVILREAFHHIENIYKRCDVCLIGPGLGVSDGTTGFISDVLSSSEIPVIIDADGINSLSGNIDILDTASCPVVLTPHDVEFSRIGGDLSSGDRIGAARDFSLCHNCILVLKGHRTISAFPDGSIYMNTTGNPGMAKGGSGDVLSGIMAALIGQDMPIKKAVTAAVYYHGKAGDICAENYGEYGMIPSDVIDAIKYAMR